MLFDLLGPLAALSTLATDHLSQLVTTLPLGAIPVWDQYTAFLRWALNSLGNIFGNGGLAIIAFTIIVKTALLPLTIKSIRSSKNMQELAPRIKELQKKYGKDRQRLSQETMALYQQHGVNPMAGCLPMVLQIPIFFGLYHAITSLSHSDTGVWHSGFLWISSLGDPDPYKILPILAGVFQFIQARMMRPAGQKVTDPQQQMMNTMMNFMPLMVVLFGWNFASGPVIYWVTQAIYSVVQQWLITGWGAFGEWFPWLPELPAHRRLGYEDPTKRKNVVVLSGEAGVVEQKGFSGWINRKMMEAQNTAQERQAETAKKSGGSAAKSNGAGGSGSGSGGGKNANAARSKNGKATASAVADDATAEDEVEVDEKTRDLIESRSKKRNSSYASRTAGTKFGAKGSSTVVSTAPASTTKAKANGKPAPAPAPVATADIDAAETAPDLAGDVLDADIIDAD
ncbi:MAG: YidC/Oxa1 family membrane protein insertase, partial [Thermomicrobiales bacterium]